MFGYTDACAVESRIKGRSTLIKRTPYSIISFLITFIFLSLLLQIIFRILLKSLTSNCELTVSPRPIET